MQFGAIVLVGNATRSKDWTLTSNAFPITPISSKILGRLTGISALKHENLCSYLELIKCQTIPQGVIIVSEHYADQFCKFRNKCDLQLMMPFNAQLYLSVSQQIGSALEFCHNNAIVIGCLSLENVMAAPPFTDRHVKVKLANFGLYHLVHDEKDIEKAICQPWYLAPESLPFDEEERFSYCSDIWSFGILLIELFTDFHLSRIWSAKQVLAVIDSLVSKTRQDSCLLNLLDLIENSCPLFKSSRQLLSSVYSTVEKCLFAAPLSRPNASAVLGFITRAYNSYGDAFQTDEPKLNPIDESIDSIKERIRNESGWMKYGYDEHSINELYFLWKLCGSNVETILVRRGIIRNRPPILTLPNLLVDDYRPYGNEELRKFRSILNVAELPCNNLVERLNAIPFDQFFISIEISDIMKNGHEVLSSHLTPREEKNSLQSLVVKERDIAYQLSRMRLFRRLLSAWPYKSELLHSECHKDIPPVYRGAAWAALLGVLPFEEDQRHEHFYAIDTFSEHTADRQLQVDIPRCHQYDELMSSPLAHYRMKLLVKALLVSRKDDYVYWQGLDSLSAPFLILHFNDLPTAFRCLSAFIERYLSGFFLRDNSTIIRNYLAEFMRVLEFADRELFVHLISLDFHPELFAIPWFLTCFAHVLPLHKLFHLWDSILLANSQFPLFIGVAILIQLRSKLLSVSFNEAILLFSDLPDLPIDEIVQIAKIHYSNWQKSND